MAGELENELEEQAVVATEELAHELRQAIIDNLPEKEHAYRLAEYISDVREVGDNYIIEIEHPMAPLHENGGPVEPSYANARAQGWVRDEIYDALDHCQEQVSRKNFMTNAMVQVRRNHE